METKINQIIDIRTPDVYYEDEELVFIALTEEGEVEIQVKSIEHLYKIAPSLGFTCLEIKEWFLNQAQKCVQGSLIQQWFLNNASKYSYSNNIN